MRSVCVFSGSSFGRDPVYADAARTSPSSSSGGGYVGVRRRQRRTHGRGGGHRARRGGEVVGVIPQHLVDKEIAHPGLSDLRVTGSMHERKTLMADLADGFVALPGGFGTLEEFAEVVTWTQLGLQHKPCGLLDVGGYYARLLAFVDHATDEGFVPVAHRRLVLSDDDPGRLLDALDAWAASGHGQVVREIVANYPRIVPQLRLALAQVDPTVGDLAGNADLVVEWTAAGRRAGSASSSRFPR